MALPTTTITGKVYTPDGVAVTEGSIVCILSQAASVNDAGSGATERVAGLSEFSIQSSGDVQGGMALVPNDAMTPTGTYYRVRFSVTAPVRAAWEESWSVPSTPDPIEIGDITRLFTAPALVLPSTYRDESWYRPGAAASISGRIFYAAGLTGAALLNVSVAPNSLIAFPFIIPRAGVLDLMLWNVSVIGGALKKGRMSIYSNASDVDPYPLNNLLDGTEYRVDQIATRTTAIALPVSAGSLLWFAFNHDSNTGSPSLTGLAATACFPIFGRGQALEAAGLGVAHPQTYTAGQGNPAVFPSSAPTIHTAAVPGLGVGYGAVA